MKFGAINPLGLGPIAENLGAIGYHDERKANKMKTKQEIREARQNNKRRRGARCATSKKFKFGMNFLNEIHSEIAISDKGRAIAWLDDIGASRVQARP